MHHIWLERPDPLGDQGCGLLPILHRMPDAAHRRTVLLRERQVDVVDRRRVDLHAVAGFHLLIGSGGRADHFDAVATLQ